MNKLKTRRATPAKTPENGSEWILTYLNKAEWKPENYFLFTLGVLSEFIPAIHDIYPIVKPVASEFFPCFKDFNQVSQDKDQVVSQFSELENKFKTPQERKTYCETAQKNIVDYHIAARIENGNLVKDTLDIIVANPISKFAVGTISLAADFGVGKIESIVSSKEIFCKETIELKAPKIQALLKKQYKTLAEFEKECLYFHKSNCGTFDPESLGLTAFAKKAYKFWGNLKTAGKCIGKILNDPTKVNLEVAKAKLGQYFTSDDFVATAMGAVLGLVANVMTLGIWGGLKGAYYLIKLGYQIKEFWANPNVDTAYKTGAIVGKAILIVKSILTGRRKLLKKK